MDITKLKNYGKIIEKSIWKLHEDFRKELDTYGLSYTKKELDSKVNAFKNNITKMLEEFKDECDVFLASRD